MNDDADAHSLVVRLSVSALVCECCAESVPVARADDEGSIDCEAHADAAVETVANGLCECDSESLKARDALSEAVETPPDWDGCIEGDSLDEDESDGSDAVALIV